MQSIILLLLKYKYLILFPLAAFEGPVLSIVVGFLIFTGALSVAPSFVVLFLGDAVPDSVFYFIGYYGHQSKYIQKKYLKSDFFINHMDKVKNLWENHTFKTMFFGKLAYGMALPFLVSAGIIKLPFKKFISYAVPIGMLQYSVLMFVGYHLGNSYNLALKYVHDAYFFVGLLLLIFIGVYILFIRFAKNKVEQMEKIK